MDLVLEGKRTLVIGVGDQVLIRARQLLEDGAKVYVLTDQDSSIESAFLGRRKNLEEQSHIRTDGLGRWKRVIEEIRPFLVVVATRDFRKDQKIAEYARIEGKSSLVYVVDRPQFNDLNMTGVAKLGDIRVGISTGGLSPAMAGFLRRKIESLIEPEDILQVKLQGQVRSVLKRSISEPELRKRVVYKLIRDKKILSLLELNRFDEAKLRALSLIEKNSQIVRSR